MDNRVMYTPTQFVRRCSLTLTKEGKEGKGARGLCVFWANYNLFPFLILFSLLFSSTLFPSSRYYFVKSGYRSTLLRLSRYRSELLICPSWCRPPLTLLSAPDSLSSLGTSGDIALPLWTFTASHCSIPITACIFRASSPEPRAFDRRGICNRVIRYYCTVCPLLTPYPHMGGY